MFSHSDFFSSLLLLLKWPLRKWGVILDLCEYGTWCWLLCPDWFLCWVAGVVLPLDHCPVSTRMCWVLCYFETLHEHLMQRPWSGSFSFDPEARVLQCLCPTPIPLPSWPSLGHMNFQISFMARQLEVFTPSFSVLPSHFTPFQMCF